MFPNLVAGFAYLIGAMFFLAMILFAFWIPAGGGFRAMTFTACSAAVSSLLICNATIVQLLAQCRK